MLAVPLGCRSRGPRRDLPPWDRNQQILVVSASVCPFFFRFGFSARKLFVSGDVDSNSYISPHSLSTGNSSFAHFRRIISHLLSHCKLLHSTLTSLHILRRGFPLPSKSEVNGFHTRGYFVKALILSSSSSSSSYSHLQTTENGFILSPICPRCGAQLVCRRSSPGSPPIRPSLLFF